MDTIIKSAIAQENFYAKERANNHLISIWQIIGEAILMILSTIVYILAFVALCD